jgi:phosphate transport system permease protein
MKNLLDKTVRLKYEEKAMLWIMRFSTLIIIITLCLILITILNKGVGSLSWEMISKTPKGGYYFGKDGGILNAIMGSVYLATGATLLAFIIGLPVTIFMNTCMKRDKRTLYAVRFILDVLTGIPSIVYAPLLFYR